MTLFLKMAGTEFDRRTFEKSFVLYFGRLSVRSLWWKQFLFGKRPGRPQKRIPPGMNRFLFAKPEKRPGRN